MLDSEISFQGKDYLRVVVRNPQFVFSHAVFFFQELFSTAQETHQPLKVKLEAT